MTCQNIDNLTTRSAYNTRKATKTAIPRVTEEAILLPMAPPDFVVVDEGATLELEPATPAGADVVLVLVPEPVLVLWLGSVLPVIWEISAGTVTGEPLGFTAPIPPSIIPGFAANIKRVCQTFWINCSCISAGTLLMSKLPPQFAAVVPAVLLATNMACVASVLLLVIMDGVMEATVIGVPAALGGLMKPNMPLGQWPGTPQ